MSYEMEKWPQNQEGLIRSSRMFPVRWNPTKGWDYTMTDNFLSAEQCQEIIHWAENETLAFATTVNEDQPSKSYRVAQTTELPEKQFPFVYDKLASEIQLINDLNYKFDLVGLLEPIQLLKYKVFEGNLKGKYDWHRDADHHGLGMRKISSIVQLSDPKDYDGCELELERACSPLPCADKNQGTLITFASWKTHRITPLERGERYSLVCWISGPPFK